MIKEQIDEIAKLICTYPQCIHYNIIGECASTECQTVDIAERLYNAGYRKQSEIVTEIVDIINKRIEINQYHLQGNNTDLFRGIYQGRYEAYRDIAEIIEQRYGAKMKGGAE